MQSIKGKSFSTKSFPDKNFFILLLLGFLVAFLRAKFSQAEDMGLFLTVSGMVSNGYQLYADIFDIKDPLFFYSAGVFLKLFGLRGPFFLDLLLVAFSAPLAYQLGKSLKLKTWVSTSSSAIFLLTLTGTYYQSFRTQIAAIDIYIISLIFLMNSRFRAAGAALVLMFGFKFPMGIFSLTLFILVLISENKFINLINLFKGIFVTFLSLTAVMQLRGEFTPYLKMLQDSFHYQQNYQEIVGQRKGLIGHLDVWNLIPSSFIYFLLAITLMLFFFLAKLITKQLFIIGFSSLFAISLFLLNSAMWPHHLQILSLGSLLISYCCLHVLDDFSSDSKRTPSQKNESFWSRDVKRAGLCVFLVASISTLGFSASLNPAMSVTHWLKPGWNVPVEIQILQDKEQMIHHPIVFSRLGSIDDQGFGAFLPQKFSFACSRTSFFGYESVEIIDKFVDCLRNEPNFIIISPQYEALNGRSGSYSYFYSKVNSVLNTVFVCEEWHATKYKFCIKILN